MSAAADLLREDDADATEHAEAVFAAGGDGNMVSARRVIEQGLRFYFADLLPQGALARAHSSFRRPLRELWAEAFTGALGGTDARAQDAAA